MRVGILGMAGRMGRLLVEESIAAGHDVVGGTIGKSSPAPQGGPATMPLSQLAPQIDVAIDFTQAGTVSSHAEALAAAGKAWVVGTTGLSAVEEAAIERAARRVPVVCAANYGIGLNLLLKIAEQLGAALPAETYDAEIVELHHRQKIDAPSGSALALGQAVARGRGVRLEDAMQSGRDGHTGPRRAGDIGFAALRAGQVVGEHTLLFASGTEHIALTHRALDRRAFAVGAVRAAAWTMHRKPGLYSMQDIIP
ncbi:MAG: 4-hydroxy-tetrahydrodipicolinate reductase [Alphaproteobacteria bacterium]|nr:4-hydroxy-tetrahydrodipicolinate reductase [Alphaproteobacteria bacterium]